MSASHVAGLAASNQKTSADANQFVIRPATKGGVMPVEPIPLASVTIAVRHRKDLGNIEALVDSITELGLLQAIGVTPDRELVFGRRRLEACRQLGWEAIPAVVLSDIDTAVDRLKAERDENTCRKQMTPSELVALAKALEEIERPKAQARSQAGKTPASRDAGVGKTDKLVADALAMSESSYRRAKRVVEAAEDENAPDEVRRVALQARERMDATGQTYGPYREVQQARRRAALEDSGDDRPAENISRVSRTRTPALFVERTVRHLRDVLAAGEIAPEIDLEAYEATGDDLATLSKAITVLETLRRRLTRSTGTPETASVDSIVAAEPAEGSTGVGEADGSAGVAIRRAPASGTPGRVESSRREPERLRATAGAATIASNGKAALVTGGGVCGTPRSFSEAEIRKTALLVVGNGAASVPLLKKRLDIDEAEARSLLGRLHEAGIVEPGDGLAWSVIVDEGELKERLDAYLA